MGVFNKFKMWLGWGPMVLAREYEVRAVEGDMKSAVPPDAPSGTLTFNRMDYYRNQILVMTAFLTFAMLLLGWFFYSDIGERFVITNVRNPVLFGAIFGFVYGIYGFLNYRKRLFKEGRLTIGYKRPKSHKYWIAYYLLYLLSLWVIFYAVAHLFGSPGFYLVIFGAAIPLLLTQWLWYYDIIRWEKKQNQVFIWKPQGWYQEVVIEPEKVES